MYFCQKNINKLTNNNMKFTLQKEDGKSRARAGLIETAH